MFLAALESFESFSQGLEIKVAVDCTRRSTNMLHEPLHLMKRNASVRARAAAIGAHLHYKNHQKIDMPVGKLWQMVLNAN